MNNVSRRMIGNKAKFNASWTGPFEIIRIVNDKTCEIREVGNEGNVEIQNIRFLKPYKVSPYTNIMNTAMMMMERSDNKREYDKIIQYAQKKRLM